MLKLLQIKYLVLVWSQYLLNVQTTHPLLRLRMSHVPHYIFKRSAVTAIGIALTNKLQIHPFVYPATQSLHIDTAMFD